jgi:hypothetical protein
LVGRVKEQTMKEAKKNEYEKGGRTGEEEEYRRVAGRTRTIEVRRTAAWRKNRRGGEE